MMLQNVLIPILEMDNSEVEIQRNYYSQTATSYDGLHLEQDKEHTLGLHLLASYIEFYNIQSVLDIGAGTGRTIIWLKQRFPRLVVKGIEPVSALREQGYAKGISTEDLLDGNAYELEFPVNSFDLVCEFAVLHHVKKPNDVVREMSRVASKMICISDCNFMAQGSLPLRVLKYLIFSLGLWPVANYLKTKGRGYTISKEDGLAYSYTVYQDFQEIQRFWQTLRTVSLNGFSDTPLGSILSAEHLLLVATNKKLLD